MDVTKPYKFIRFGAMDVTKPYKFIGLAQDGVLSERPNHHRDVRAAPPQTGPGPRPALGPPTETGSHPAGSAARFGPDWGFVFMLFAFCFSFYIYIYICFKRLFFYFLFYNYGFNKVSIGF